MSQFGHLGEWREDPHLTRAEVYDHCFVTLDEDDPAEAVLIVGYLVADSELLNGRRSHRRHVEGTSWQGAPGRGAGWIHHLPLCALLASKAALLAREGKNVGVGDCHHGSFR
jgi:hypothetical protein